MVISRRSRNIERVCQGRICRDNFSSLHNERTCASNLSSGVFSGFSSFLPIFIVLFSVSVNKISYNKCDFNSVKPDNWAVPSYHVVYSVLHVISARCVVRDLCTIASWPLECKCWRKLTAQSGNCNQSWTAPFRVITFAVTLLIIIMIKTWPYT